MPTTPSWILYLAHIWICPHFQFSGTSLSSTIKRLSHPCPAADYQTSMPIYDGISQIPQLEDVCWISVFLHSTLSLYLKIWPNELMATCFNFEKGKIAVDKSKILAFYRWNPTSTKTFSNFYHGGEFILLFGSQNQIWTYKFSPFSRTFRLCKMQGNDPLRQLMIWWGGRFLRSGRAVRRRRRLWALKGNGILKLTKKPWRSKDKEYVNVKPCSTLLEVPQALIWTQIWRVVLFLVLVACASEEKPKTEWQDHSSSKAGFPLWKGQ